MFKRSLTSTSSAPFFGSGKALLDAKAGPGFQACGSRLHASNRSRPGPLPKELNTSPEHTNFHQSRLHKVDYGGERSRLVRWEAALRLIAQKFHLYGEIEDSILDYEGQLAFGEPTRASDAPQDPIMKGLVEHIPGSQSALDHLQRSGTELTLPKVKDLLFAHYDVLSLTKLTSIAMTIEQASRPRIGKAQKLDLDYVFHEDNADHVMSSVARSLTLRDSVGVDELKELLKKLMDKKYYVPAKTIMDCLLASRTVLGPEIYNAALELSIVSGNEEQFCRYQQIFEYMRLHKEPEEIVGLDQGLRDISNRIFPYMGARLNKQCGHELTELLTKGYLKFGLLQHIPDLISWAGKSGFLTEDVCLSIAHADKVPLAQRQKFIGSIFDEHDRLRSSHSVFKICKDKGIDLPEIRIPELEISKVKELEDFHTKGHSQS